MAGPAVAARRAAAARRARARLGPDRRAVANPYHTDAGTDNRADDTLPNIVPDYGRALALSVRGAEREPDVPAKCQAVHRDGTNKHAVKVAHARADAEPE